jgi:hypothetical protein
VLGLILLTSPPGTTSAGLGILLVVAASALLVPALAALVSKTVASLVLVAAAARFAISGGYEVTSAPGWRYAAGVCGIVVAGLALYGALAGEMGNATRRNLLPLPRPAAGRRAVSGQLADPVAPPSAVNPACASSFESSPQQALAVPICHATRSGAPESGAAAVIFARH